MDYQKSTFEEFILLTFFKFQLKCRIKMEHHLLQWKGRNEGMKSVPTSNPRRGRR